jgi:ABC-type branched-subunit amino acid transport system ATPase component
VSILLIEHDMGLVMRSASRSPCSTTA